LNGLPGVIGIDPPYQAASLKVRNGTLFRSIQGDVAQPLRSTDTTRGSFTISSTGTSPPSIQSIATGPSGNILGVGSDFQYEIGTAAASWPAGFVSGESSFAATPPTCGFRTPGME
jgi:hypothetical protein